MRAIKLLGEKSALAHANAKFLALVDHYMFSVLIRSPWFPRPSTLPVDAWTPGRAAAAALEAAGGEISGNLCYWDGGNDH